jgi:hypothetical protein
MLGGGESNEQEIVCIHRRVLHSWRLPFRGRQRAKRLWPINEATLAMKEMALKKSVPLKSGFIRYRPEDHPLGFLTKHSDINNAA